MQTERSAGKILLPLKYGVKNFHTVFLLISNFFTLNG